MVLHDRTWIWNSEWREHASEKSAGGFIHFRKHIKVDYILLDPVMISITADTRYKLYINSRFVHYGPVKGDAQLWFYDELDIRPYLCQGINHIAVHVLRLYHNTRFGTSFPRLPYGGLRIQHLPNSTSSNDHVEQTRLSFNHADVGFSIDTDDTWETAVDLSASLPALKDDMFLHIYEFIDRRNDSQLNWIPAKQLKTFVSFGLVQQWNLSPRLIPVARLRSTQFRELHNVRSPLSKELWEEALLGKSSIVLPAGTIHHIEAEAKHHLTAFLLIRCLKPNTGGSVLKITYSECYEDPPVGTNRHLKADRRDTTKQLYGPYDTFILGPQAGANSTSLAQYHNEGHNIEILAPYHFRTFRFISIDIQVASDSDLTFHGIKITRTNYPLNVLANFQARSLSNHEFPVQKLWDTSILTLENCMHDCYEDCPFYEQLQYAMDTRSSALFTYYVSGDDRLARQAIRQLANSFQPALGLTASRAPCHHTQIIPHFSLFWILIVADHFEHYGDADFTSQFLPICDAVLTTFKRRIDPNLGLVRVYPTEEFWDFVDWTQNWQPYGVPPAGRRTGFQAFSSSLYAYTLQRLVSVLRSIGRIALANEYELHWRDLTQAIRTHCYDGSFFTDGLAQDADSSTDYSIHGQVWAILSGAIAGPEAASLLDKTLQKSEFTSPSIAMSFYTLRALSLVGANMYETHFFKFWGPWVEQLSQNLTTWVEDPVSQRSDCHAWGSVPLYEFLAEVAGIKPLEPGWKTISFQPRISLFQNVHCKMPIVVKGISEQVIVEVTWSTEESGKTNVALGIRTASGKAVDVPSVVSLGHGHREVVRGGLLSKTTPTELINN